MYSFLEKQVLDKFMKVLESDPSVPKDLFKSLSELYQTDKISKGTNLKILLEEYKLPLKLNSNENK